MNHKDIAAVSEGSSPLPPPAAPGLRGPAVARLADTLIRLRSLVIAARARADERLAEGLAEQQQQFARHLDELTDTIALLNAERETLRGQVQEAEARNETLFQDLTDAVAAVTAQRDALKEDLAARDQAGREARDRRRPTSAARLPRSPTFPAGTSRAPRGRCC